MFKSLSSILQTSRGAYFSRCGLYRYLLWRTIPRAREEAGTIAWLMLNPSTADANADDPTIRRCLGFSRAWGYRRLLVVNLFALRATQPAVLARARSPVGKENDRAIIVAAGAADLMVCAWGVHGSLRERDQEVHALLNNAGTELRHVGVTRSGHPRHPLYLRASVRPMRWGSHSKSIDASLHSAETSNENFLHAGAGAVTDRSAASIDFRSKARRF